MTESDKSQLQVLKRHHMFQTATVYAVAGWLLIQVADVALETFDAPSWIMQSVLLFVLAGFPVTLAIVWLIGRTRTEGSSLQTSPVIIIVVAALFSGGGAIWLLKDGDEPAPDSSDAPKVSSVRQSNPVLAVLPFTNMSSSAENEYIADGMTEDVITLLAQSPGVEVIARNSTFKYKNQSPDVRDVGKDLGADYVVEGSIRPLQERIRVTIQVIDTSTGSHVWAEQYDRPLSEFFAVQDEVSLGVAAAVGDAVFREEYNAVDQSRTDNLTSWVLTSRADVNFSTNLFDETSLPLARDAVELDPEYALAHAVLGRQLAVISLAFGWPNTESNWPGAIAYRDEAEAEARLAAKLAPDDAKVLSFMAIALLWTGHAEEALSTAERAIAISPSYVEGLAYYADILIHNGRSREAIPYFDKAIRLTPNAPQLGFYHFLRGEALMHHGDFLAAEESLTKANRVYQGKNQPVLQYLAGTQLRLGKSESATLTKEDADGLTGTSIDDARRIMEFYSIDGGGEYFKSIWEDLARL